MTNLTPAPATMNMQGHAPTITIRSRAYFSITHLSSAAYFLGSAYQIESKRSQLNDDEKIKSSAEHRAYVSSTIMLSVAYVEATINELFSDCAEDVASRMEELPGARDMGLLWRNGVPRTAKYRLIEKYNKALELNQRPLLDVKTLLVKDLELLTQLRNALMHYEPETVTTYSSNGLSDADLHKFEQRFKGKFKLNALTGEGNVFYPDKLLGCGCADWALCTAVDFVSKAFQLLGITPIIDSPRTFVSKITKRPC